MRRIWNVRPIGVCLAALFVIVLNAGWNHLGAAGSTPYGGSPVTLPGTVQAENFDNGGEGIGYHDTTTSNAGGQYRTTDVDIEAASGGGYDVGWIAAGEWLNYTVKVTTAGNYTAQLRVASPSGGSLHLGFNTASNVWKVVTIPATGGWQNWTTVSVPVTLSAGTQQITLLADTSGFNVDSITVVSSSTGGGSTPPPATGPYSGTAITLPGTVQAENFDNGGEGVAYHDTTATNSGGQYRATGVDIEASSPGGYNVGWIYAGEWMKYSVNVTTAGSYTAQVRVASPSGGALHLAFTAPSNVSAAVSIPATGGWQNWTTVSIPVTLGAGPQQMTLLADTAGFNVDAVTVLSGGTGSTGGGSTPPPTVTISMSTPTSGASFTAPATISLAAAASTSSGTITKVDFYNGSTLIGSTTTSPYTGTWSNVAAGSYSLSAKATNSAGVTSSSSSVNVTISSSTPPPPTVTISMNSPTSGASYAAPATISLSATASTSSGTITKVDFYNGSTLIGSTTNSPYNATWSNVAAGSYSFAAKATNSAGVTASSSSVNVTVSSSTPPPVTSGGLVKSGNLVYQGSFRVPFANALKVAGTDRGFDYGGLNPAYNPLNNSLFLMSHVYDQQTAELNIPAVLGTGSVSSWPVATVRSAFVDPVEGQLRSVATGSGDTVMIGGQLVYNAQLYVNGYVYYGTTASKTHWRRSTNLTATGTLQGPFAVGPMGSDFYNGYMGVVPPEWVSALGGPVLNGQCCLSIISRTSYGPAVSAMDPTQLGSVTVNATDLVAYPNTHKTLGDWGTAGTNAYFNGTSQIKGVVFPSGTSSVLFFGRHGLGSYCYGEGSTCNDPEDGDKGDHAYPYAYYVWAYDAHDLAAVKSGQKQPWDVKPYAVWSLSLPASSRAHRLGGVAYDPATGRLFISQQFVDGDSGDYPVIHVYKVNVN